MWKGANNGPHPNLGVQFFTKETERWRPCQRIPLLGSFATTSQMRVEMEESKRRKGQEQCGHTMELDPGGALLARTVLTAVSCLNFAKRLVPAIGFPHLRSGWEIFNASGVTEKWRAGSMCCRLPRSDHGEFRGDSCWLRGGMLCVAPEAVRAQGPRLFYVRRVSTHQIR